MKNISYDLVLRKDVKNNHNVYYYLTVGDLKFSVVNLGELMKSAPKEVRDTVFSGWEALLLSDKNEEDADYECIRSKDKKSLIEDVYNAHKYHIDQYNNSNKIRQSIKQFPRYSNRKNIVDVEENGRKYILRAGEGGIRFEFEIKDNRATCENYKENGNIPFNHASTSEEVERLIGVLIQLLRLMK